MTGALVADAHPAGDAVWPADRLVERLRRWHHRNPFARRVSASEVGGVGWVALPYGPGEGGVAKPLFHEPALLPGLSHRELVAFAARHAVASRPGADDWPVRQLERTDAPPDAPPDPPPSDAAPQMRYLLTAAIGHSKAPSALPLRVLMAPDSTTDDAPIWGPRQLSRARIGGAAAVALLGIAAAVSMAWRGRDVVTTSVAAPAASSASPAPSAPELAAPVPVPMPASRAVAPVGTPAAPASTAPHFALVSARSRQRPAADATLQKLRQTLGPAIGDLQSQVMSTPEGFVVTLWPLATQADAERMAAVLERRGLAMTWMEF
jgi:hypothetical protein